MNSLILHEIKTSFLGTLFHSRTLLQILKFFKLTSNEEIEIMKSKPFFNYFSDKISEHNLNIRKINKTFIDETVEEICEQILTNKQTYSSKIQSLQDNISAICKQGKNEYLKAVTDASSLDCQKHIELYENTNTFILSLFRSNYRFGTTKLTELIERTREFTKNKIEEDEESRKRTLDDIFTLGMNLQNLDKRCQVDNLPASDRDLINRLKKLLADEVPEEVFLESFLMLNEDQNDSAFMTKFYQEVEKIKKKGKGYQSPNLNPHFVKWIKKRNQTFEDIRKNPLIRKMVQENLVVFRCKQKQPRAPRGLLLKQLGKKNEPKSELDIFSEIRFPSIDDDSDTIEVNQSIHTIRRRSVIGSDKYASKIFRDVSTPHSSLKDINFDDNFSAAGFDDEDFKFE